MQKTKQSVEIKKQYDTIKSSVIRYLGDNGKTNILKSVVILFLFSVFLTLFQFILHDCNTLQLHGPIYLNFMPIFLITCLLYFVIGKLCWTITLSTIFMSLLHAINHYKIKFRDEPLTPSDFSLGKEAGNIAQGYNLTPDGKVYFIIFVCIIIVAFSFVFIKNKRPCFEASMKGIAITLTVMLCLYQWVYKNTDIYDSFYSDKVMYHETEIVNAQGLVYSLINMTNTMRYEKPEGYSTERVTKILEQFPAPVYSKNTPDVIAVMFEAYTDMQDWKNLQFIGENPYSYINDIKAKGCYGEIFVPGFGGETAITEFEFLTGNNTSAISPSMPVAYNTIITDDIYSIERVFADMGYKSSSMHPGHPWFYNRQNVYQRMGFDKFVSKYDLQGNLPEVNFYTKDEVAADMIINDYKAHMAQNPDKGYFNFTVTIQNHGPYNNTNLLYEKEYISKEANGLTDEEYYTINNYLGGIYDSGMFIKAIYEYINTLDKPTVFIIFGDHLPYLGVDETLYDKLGLDIKSNTFEAYLNRHSTDYLIIGNNAYLKDSTPSVNGQQDTVISANYLSIKLFQYMNMELPPFHAFSYEMMQYAPILSNMHNGSNVGFGEALPEEFDKKYNEFQILQYYNLKDYKAKNTN